MKLLLDTQLLVWLTTVSRRLPPIARELIADEKNESYFSVAAIWEVAIKNERYDDFAVDPRILRRGLLHAGYKELPITSEHAITVASLPPIHGDPFDRIMIAQASVEGITLLTVDGKIAQYPGPIHRL